MVGLPVLLSGTDEQKQNLIRELAVQRDHPVHALLRRLAEEVGAGSQARARTPKNENAAALDLQALVGGQVR